MPGTKGLRGCFVHKRSEKEHFFRVWKALQTTLFCLRVKNFYFVFSGHFLIRKYIIIYKQQFTLPYICWPLKLGKISLSFTRVEGLGIMRAQQSSDATSTPSPASWFPSRGPPRESPSEAAARVGEEETHCGGLGAATRQGQGVPGLRLPLFQVLLLSARPGIPPEARSWWHILLWPIRAEAGQGAGKENRASAPNDVTLSSSKTLAFVFLPSFPVNKFPRAVRANWPGSPKSGRVRAVPRLLCSVGAPGAGGLHTSRAATARDPAGRALEPAPPQTPTPMALPLAQLREAPLAPLARPVPAPRPLPRPLGPPRTAPRPRHHPGAGPGAPWLQAARRASPRLPQRPRLLLRLLPRLADGACHQTPRRRGIWEASAACVELRPERAPPSRPPVRPPVTSSPLCPPSAARSAPRPAPPRPPGSAHPAGRCQEGGRQGRCESRDVRCPWGLWYGGPVVSWFVPLTTVYWIRISCLDLLLLWFYCHCRFVIVVIVIFISSFTLLELTGWFPWGGRWQTRSLRYWPINLVTPILPVARTCATFPCEVNKLCDFWRKFYF